MRFSLYKKQVALTIAIMLVFIVIGLFAAFLVSQSERVRAMPSSPAMFARLIDELISREGISPNEAVALLQSSSESGAGPFSFAVKSDRDVADALHVDFNSLVKEPYQSANRSLTHPADGPTPTSYIRLKTGAFLAVDFRRRDHTPGPKTFFVYNFIALVLAVLLASFISVSFLFYSMKAKALLVADVISRIQGGDLKARFPIARLDEAGELMHKFNVMAEEIEGLVARVRSTEHARMRLLQELAHDLRTPIASLKSLLETLNIRIDSLSPEHRMELISLSLKEIDYFQHLVEDLLFLAQVTDPKYQAIKAAMDLTELIEEEINGVAVRYQSARSTGRSPAIAVHQQLAPLLKRSVKGDVHLLRRLLRNAFENAFSFARNQVSVEAKVSGDRIEIRVTDDGPGVSSEVLTSFGEKRATRVLAREEKGRISVGLGSVIMRAVAQAHDGQITLSNLTGIDGSATGAELLIVLKVS